MRIGIIYAALSASFLFGVQASALEETSLRFYAVGKMFDSGKSFEFSKNTGWYSGRCWRPYSDNAQNGLLVMQQRKLDGPGFSTVQKFSIYQFSNRSPRVFDNLPKPLTAEEKRRNYGKQWSDIIATAFLNDWRELGRMNSQDQAYRIAVANLPAMSLRRSADDKYFIVKRGETLNCYFFKKLVQKKKAE